MTHINNDIIPSSELILNADGSVYHLNLKPSDIAPTIITVGDQDRVAQVAKHFNEIETTVQHREFKTVTGWFSGKRLTVISTGIGTDNIDIVLNELDALVNIDFETRQVRPTFTPLTFVRIGTSGAMQPDVPIDSFIASAHALSFDNLLRYYPSNQLKELANWPMLNLPAPILTMGNAQLLASCPPNFMQGVTATMPGFYAPQGRQFRLKSAFKLGLTDLQQLDVLGQRVLNIEMETAGIYGLSTLLGHRAISLNAILANRATGVFSQQPTKTIEALIEQSLNWLVKAV